MPELSGPGESWAGNVQGKLFFFCRITQKLHDCLCHVCVLDNVSIKMCAWKCVCEGDDEGKCVAMFCLYSYHCIDSFYHPLTKMMWQVTQVKLWRGPQDAR